MNMLMEPTEEEPSDCDSEEDQLKHLLQKPQEMVPQDNNMVKNEFHETQARSQTKTETLVDEHTLTSNFVLTSS